MKALALLSGLLLAGLMTTGAAWAAEPKLIGTYTDWDAFSIGQGAAQECYVLTVPKAETPSEASHGAVYAMVSIKPRKKVTGEFTFGVGYALKPGSDVTLSSGGFKQTLFVDGQTAWAYDGRADAAIVAAMKGGQTLGAKAISSRGTNTSYQFSLSGFSAALSAAAQACGAK
jgi:invasion protein IalB